VTDRSTDRSTDTSTDRSTDTAPYPAATVLDAALDAADRVSSPVDAVSSVTHELAQALGAVRVSFLIADMSGRALVRLTHVAAADLPGGSAAPDVRHPTAVNDPDDRQDDREHAAVLPFDGGPQEQVVRAQVPRVLPPGTGPAASPAGWTVLAPVTERGEALGLLEMVLPAEPDTATVAEIGRAARVLAFVVIADRRHTDLFEWGQRTRPFTLSAEIQRRLLPAAYTCESGSFSLAAWLEPAASVGGDTFDYSLARDVLHLSMTDAMGHGVGSALTATLCVSALRTVRRTGGTVPEQAARANDALVAHAVEVSSEAFATGLVGRLDLATGALDLLNAGHVPPFLARGGDVTVVDLPAGLPFGLFAGATHATTRLQLRPGDRLVLVTDGMIERNAAGFALEDGIRETRHQHPRDAVRLLSDKVLEACGQELADDATLLVLDWTGGHDLAAGD
jgi:serine phosphatase RsbU (regulator of sigma subunit)